MKFYTTVIKAERGVSANERANGSRGSCKTKTADYMVRPVEAQTVD